MISRKGAKSLRQEGNIRTLRLGVPVIVECQNLNRDTPTRFDSDELIQRMSFLANLLLSPKVIKTSCEFSPI